MSQPTQDPTVPPLMSVKYEPGGTELRGALHVNRIVRCYWMSRDVQSASAIDGFFYGLFGACV